MHSPKKKALSTSVILENQIALHNSVTFCHSVVMHAKILDSNFWNGIMQNSLFHQIYKNIICAHFIISTQKETKCKEIIILQF